MSTQPDLPPPGTKFSVMDKRLDEDGRFRMVSDKVAYESTVVCDMQGNLVKVLPPFTQFSVLPTLLGYPNFEQSHPAEYYELKRQFEADLKRQHEAGELSTRADEELTPDIVEDRWSTHLHLKGNRILWDRTPESRKAMVLSDEAQFILIQKLGDRFASIKYAAIFEIGGEHSIVYLSQWLRDELTVKDIPNTPSYPEQEANRRRELTEVANRFEAAKEQLSAKAKRSKAARTAGVHRFTLKDDRAAAREIRKHLKARAKAHGPRGLAKAIRELKNGKEGDWLDTRYHDLAPQVRALSTSTLRNLASGSTGLILNRNFKP